MPEISDRSVHLVVTSPPYWQLKDYGTQTEIGFNDSYESYINHLNLVWQEAYRVLGNGCRLCINIGDQYARAAYYGRYKVIPIRTEIIKFCETLGFDYMGAIIWQKIATVNTSGGAVIMGSYPYPRNGIVKLDYEFILIFKKGGKPEPVDKAIKERSKMTKEEWNTYFYGHWNFPGEKQNKHLAMFPMELPYRLIKMFTFVGDTVLDPFAGSGTTSLAALETNRNSIGYEINKEFIPLIQEKLNNQQNRKTNDPQIIFKTRHAAEIDFQAFIDKLPYIFKDPVSLSTKVKDVKTKQYGSRIDKESSRNREEYFRVKEILSPIELVLSDGRKIRLLGIEIDPQKQEQAMAFLQEKLKKSQVYLKFDKRYPLTENAEGNAIPCYLYLKNKTFINAHLLKQNLAIVDTDIEFKHKKRFQTYATD